MIVKKTKLFSFIYKYNNNKFCYVDCPNGTYKFENINDFLWNDEIPEGYYLENKIIKKCYNSCKKCVIGGNVTNNNCLECKLNYTFYNNSINIKNCYKECDGYYYFDKSNNFHCSRECPED